MFKIYYFMNKNNVSKYCVYKYLIIPPVSPESAFRPRGYKTFFMLNSIEHEIFPAHKS